LAKTSYFLGQGAGFTLAVGLLLPDINGVDIGVGCCLLSAGCGLLALFLGVIALVCMLLSHGHLVGRDRAIAGFVLGVVCVLMLGLVCPITSSPHQHPSIIFKSFGEVKCLACAVEAYHKDYNRYPGQEATKSDHHYSGDEYRLLVDTLRGSNCVWNGQASNPRGRIYFQVDKSSYATTNGSGTARVGELADPWGNRYEIVADWNGDGKIDAPLADGEGVQRRGVVAWSYGRRGKVVANPNDANHLRSWK